MNPLFQRWFDRVPSRRALLCVLAGALALLAACTPAAEPTPTATPTAPAAASATSNAPPASPTSVPTDTPTVEPTSAATATRTATVPPSATPTREPTATGEATATETAPAATATAAVQASPTSPPPATQAGSGDFSPTVASVWNTAIVGTDNVSGPCSNTLTPAYGLVQITPNGDTLTWRNQEPSPYTFVRVGDNTWQYSGPTALGDGNVTMTVEFTSATTLVMTRVFAPSAEPGCTHTHNYTGTFQWNS